MVDLRSPLNDRQLSVLEWIGAGCPDGVMQGHTYKTVAIALQNRHLVAVSRKGGTWHAELTETGRYYLEHGKHPPSPTKRRSPSTPVPRPRVRHRPQPASGTDHTPSAGTTGPVHRADDDPAEVLVRRVLDAGGVLEINHHEGRSDYDPLIAAAKHAPSLPFGKQLRQRSKGNFLNLSYEFYFDEDFTVRVDERPVPVPERVPRYHQAVAIYRGDTDRHEVGRESLGRASRLLHALAVEAERRGYSASAVVARSPGAQLKAGQLMITVGGYDYSLRIREKSGPGGGPPPRYSLHRKPMPRWELTRQTKFLPTGSLTLTIDEGYRRDGRPAEFRDTKATLLEQRLPAVLRELEIRALEDEERRQDEERRAQEKRRRWEQAIERAKHQLRESNRAEVLRNQLERWHTANRLDAYLAAMTPVVSATSSPDDRVEAERWLAWATEYRNRIYPLHHRLEMPPDPEPTPEALRPFLDGWSPYGPDRFG